MKYHYTLTLDPKLPIPYLPFVHGRIVGKEIDGHKEIQFETDHCCDAVLRRLPEVKYIIRQEERKE